MNFLVGTYQKNIYQVELDNKKEMLVKSSVVYEVEKPTYLSKIPEGYISLGFRNGLFTIEKLDNNFNLIILNSFTEAPCHISYSSKLNLYFISSYHHNALLIFDNNLNLIEKKTYGDNAKIHYASYIESIDKLLVVSLGHNKIYTYDFIKEFLHIDTINFSENSGPRHLVFDDENKTLYVVHELIPGVSKHEYKKNAFNSSKLYTVPTNLNASGSAIRLSKNNFLYVANRGHNTISVFDIKDMHLIQTISTEGDHPRDFNLSSDNQYLICANMNSNNLTLYKILNDGKLLLLQKDFYLDKGCCVVF